MSPEKKIGTVPFEEPFPLRTLFRRWFIPALAGFIGLFLALIGFVSNEVVESIYLEMAQRRAQSIATSVSIHAPLAWTNLMEGKTSTQTTTSTDTTALVEAFSNEVGEMNLLDLKVYGLDHKVLFSTYKNSIGTYEEGSVLHEVIKNSTPQTVKKSLKNNIDQYEFYVPVFDENGKLRAVFELYEPVDYLDKILDRAVIPAVVIPGILLLMLSFALNKLVNRAQVHIDARTHEACQLRKKVESFVSSTAARAAKLSGFGGKIPSRNIKTTLLFSDVRSFTGFAEQNPPETVVDFLNRIMTLQVTIIQQNEGDVDKMIGDAILARFDGTSGNDHAIAAARAILHAIKKETFPRTLGIGVYRGDVISGAIGPEDRRDYTVIGDAVNVAARLCAAARADELVTDTALAHDDFGPPESIHVKGRIQPISIRRLKVTLNDQKIT